MFQKFKNHIQTNFSYLTKSQFYIAVSGGIDSIVLVHLFQQLNSNFELLHCNFQLRGEESDADMHFVQTFAEANNLSVKVALFETEKIAEQNRLSIQETARLLRYSWFYEQMEANNVKYTVTAHHLNDDLETFLINFTRGTGLDGLTGIPVKNDQIIRPILPFSREEIEEYALENNLKWREDSSNASDKYLRNKIRHHLVPILKELNPSFLESFKKTQQHLKQAQFLSDEAALPRYNSIVKEFANGTLQFDVPKLMNLYNYQAYLYQWLKLYGFTAWNDIYDLVKAEPGKKIYSENYFLQKDRMYLILSPRILPQVASYQVEKKDDQVNIPLKLSFCNVSDISISDSNCIFVDEDLIEFPLIIRKMEKEDIFYPFGMKGKKKLSKFFKDEKMSFIDKTNSWILSYKKDIIWVIGIRADDRFKVTTNTTNILKITLQ